MTNGRNKGAAFERTIAKAIIDTTGFVVKRNLEQYRTRAAGDLLGVPGWSVECKHYRSGSVFRPEWWEQAVEAAEADDSRPALVFRFNRQPVWVAVRARDCGVCHPAIPPDQPVILPLAVWLGMLPRA